MPRPCSYNFKGNLLFALSDAGIFAISKGTQIPNATVLSLPATSPRVLPQESDFSSTAPDAYVHTVCEGKVTCVKSSSNASPKRAKSDEVTYILRGLVINTKRNLTLRQACVIQGALSEKDYANMVKAHKAVSSMSVTDFFANIVSLGSLLDPSVQSFRKGPAVFSSSRNATAPSDVQSSLKRLKGFLSGNSLPLTPQDALEYYYAFEEIHPLQDGNGRIGMLLYNMLIGSLNDPCLPPDKSGWGGS